MLNLLQLSKCLVRKIEVMRARRPRQMKGAFFRSEVSGKYCQDKEKIGGQERRQNHPQRNMRQPPFVGAQDRDHQQRQEEEGNIRLEIARTYGVGLNDGEIQEISDLALDMVVAHQFVATACVIVGRGASPDRIRKRRA
jgi:hypothetical protein